ncbi:MAG: hypothetical protein KKH22_06740 [Proteobacteria bacterium]|nr:hypothetical protein [Pseudomonadota bacterium]
MASSVVVRKKLNTEKILNLQNTEKPLAGNFSWPKGWAWDDRLMSVMGEDGIGNYTKKS